MLEAARLREVVRDDVAEVPFADHEPLVTESRQILGQDPLVEAETVALVLPERSMDAEPPGGLAGHQGSTRGTAGRLDVEAVELHALAREAVEGRRPDLAPVVADVVPAEIVRQDDDDVGPLRRGLVCRGDPRDGREKGQDREPGEPGHAPSRRTRSAASAFLASAIRLRPWPMRG